jgi:hypothetical protein
MSLRDLTKEAHTNAERQEFVKILFSGTINPKLYAVYLKNQHPQYELVEVCAMMHPGLLSGMPDVRRAPHILADFIELWGDDEEEPQILPVVKRYMDHISNNGFKPFPSI